MNKLNFFNKGLLLTYYGIFMLIIAVAAFNNPKLNWDMIAYAAAAKHIEIDNKITLHKFIFSSLKTRVDVKKYYILTDGGIKYRRDMLTRPDLFSQQLPFYEIRPAYVFSIFLISKLGIDIFTSTYMVSIISIILSIFLLFLSIKNRVPISFLYAFPFLLSFVGILEIAKFSTPDAMTFLSLSVFIYLLNKSKISLLLMIIPLFILVRTDLIIFNFLLYIAFFILYKNSKKNIFVSAALSLSLYLLVNYIFDNYGWSTVFSFTFLGLISNPADVIVNVSFSQYFNVLTYGFFQTLHNKVFLFFVGFMICTIYLIRKYAKPLIKNKEIWVYSIIPIAYIIIHFLLFPVMWERFFVGFYVMGILSLLLLFSKPKAKSTKKTNLLSQNKKQRTNYRTKTNSK